MCVHQLDNNVFDIIDARCNREVHIEINFDTRPRLTAVTFVVVLTN